MVLSRGGKKLSRGGKGLMLSIILGILMGVNPYFSQPLMAKEPVTKEQLIKAAFVYNFLKFVKLPENHSEITICVEGNSPMREALTSLEGKRVENKVIQLKICSLRFDPKACQVLFLANGSEKRIKEMVKGCEKDGILTISDLPEAVDNGVMIGLIKREGKIRFEINLRSAKKAGIFISSKLLRLSQRVVK